VTRAISSSAEGSAGTTEFRVFFKNEGKVISPWHDIVNTNIIISNFAPDILFIHLFSFHSHFEMVNYLILLTKFRNTPKQKWKFLQKRHQIP
jgi:hypothetical protein